MGSFWSYVCCCCCCCCQTVKKKSKKTDIKTQKSKGQKSDGKTENSNKDKLLNSKIRDELRDKKVKNVIIDENSDTTSLISISSHISDEETEEQIVIEKERLEEEMKNSVKGGENAYENVVQRQKSLSIQHYNELGLIDKNSKEFISVQHFMSIKGYKVIESIGSGNYAEVYRAFCNKTSRDVAIKVIDLTKTTQCYRINFLPREVSIVRKLRHKNIIRIFEMFRAFNRIYMVMELATNGTIADWLRRNGSFTEYTARIVFKLILEGLDHMHSQKIAHRDLKLENILLTESLNPKISDFSYAVIVDPKRPKSETFCGTFFYFAPEILQQLPYNPFIADVWSLGVCLYIMLNNTLPFKNDMGDRDMLAKQLNGDWHFRKRIESQISQQLKQFIGLMLEPDINKRATTKDLLKHEWISNT